MLQVAVYIALDLMNPLLRFAAIVPLFLLLGSQTAQAQVGICAGQSTGVPFTGELPSNFRQIPPCSNAQPIEPYNFYWAFLGMAQLTGLVEFSSEGDFSQIVFYPDEHSRKLLPRRLKILQLEDFDRHRALRLPQLSNAISCKRSALKLTVPRIEMISDETDRSGQFARNYRIERVGSWTACVG